MFFHRRDTEVSQRFAESFSLRISARPLRLCGEIVFFFFVLSTIAHAETYTVAPTQSIQAAINAAQPGDTIQVQAGTYNENLTLNKSLTLIGQNKPIVRGTGKDSTIIVTAENCTIQGFVIERCGSDLQQEDSGLLLKSNYNHIADNELRDILYGIYLLKSSDNTIQRNVIRGRPELEMGDRGAGLHLWNSPNNTLADNTITEARDGMYIQSSPGNLITRNRVTRLRYGLHFMNSDNNTFEDNIFSDNIAGAAIMYSKRIALRRNAFINNRGFSSFGILFQDCDECITENNFIINNACGVFLEALRKSRFTNNVIAENDVAMQIYSSASGCEFSGNNFVENLSPLQLVGRETDTRWQQNFWSDYDGYDLDSDGTGDVAHKVQNVFEYLEGNFPRLRLYFNSPAAQALATAERTFPIIKGSSLADATPRSKAASFTYPFTETATQRAPQIVLAILSILMFGLAAATIWKGQRQ
ncbi:MAG TPA: nitrous oxide reductase family maturation protein NosD [Blastocatellia bacterium]|nr:nitrous oxide reductase family maturation protein NosD [Blastocatellia bacterium]